MWVDGGEVELAGNQEQHGVRTWDIASRLFPRFPLAFGSRANRAKEPVLDASIWARRNFASYTDFMTSDKGDANAPFRQPPKLSRLPALLQTA